jgi:hypothetical protein
MDPLQRARCAALRRDSRRSHIRPRTPPATKQSRTTLNELAKVREHMAAVHVDAESVARDNLVPLLRRELEQAMTRVRPADLSAAEITAMLVVLRPAHCRVIGGPAERPGLRIVGERSD